jgi:hypothetical protein
LHDPLRTFRRRHAVVVTGRVRPAARISSTTESAAPRSRTRTVARSSDVVDHDFGALFGEEQRGWRGRMPLPAPVTIATLSFRSPIFF